MAVRDVLGSRWACRAPVAELASHATVGRGGGLAGGHNGPHGGAPIWPGPGSACSSSNDGTRLGGACTVEQPFPDPAWLVSPCAYSVGLLHPVVVDELGLRDRGYRVQLVDPHMWCPFEDGTSIALWDDPARSAAAVAELAPGDVAGYEAYDALFDRIRTALRHGRRDTWVGDAPDRAEIEELLAGDAEAIDVVFEASIAEVVEHHVRKTNGCARRCTARASSAPGPGRATPARPASTSCTRRGASKDGPGRGDTWTAAWGGCRSPWPTRRSRRGR